MNPRLEFIDSACQGSPYQPLTKYTVTRSSKTNTFVSLVYVNKFNINKLVGSTLQ